MATVTTPVNYEAFVQSDEGEWPAHATFDGYSDPGDVWAFVDSAKARLERQYPARTFTGHVRRTDSVVTDIAHP